MIVRHNETRRSSLSGPSVRFYRTIAFSFLILTVVLLGVVVFITSKKAMIVVAAKEDAKTISLSVGVGAVGNDADKITGTVTSSVFNWSETYYPTGSKSVEGTAIGEVIIYNKGNSDQVLIKTTRLLNPNGVLFRLSDKVRVPANGQAVAQVYADKPGKDGEIGPSQFTIPGLSADRQLIIYAESKSAMKGGLRQVGALSEADITAAKADFGDKVRAAFLESLKKDQSVAGSGKLVSVATGEINCDKKAGDEVDSFTLSGASTVVFVSYSENALKDLVNKEITKKVDVGGERVLSTSGESKPSLASYDLAAGTAQLSLQQGVVVTLDPDAEKLSPNNFLGQSKDTIERSILGLDHVAGVSVDFSPSWIGKTPTVPDKIKVIIKNVK